MKLSTRGEYGVRALAVLAHHYQQGPLPLRVIAQKEHLSETYLEQLFRDLKKSGIIKSIRGPKGGYILAKNPKDISVGDAVRVLEGPLGPVDCVLENKTSEGCCTKEGSCITRFVWAKLRDSMAKVLDEISFEDIVKDIK